MKYEVFRPVARQGSKGERGGVRGSSGVKCVKMCKGKMVSKNFLGVKFFLVGFAPSPPLG